MHGDSLSPFNAYGTAVRCEMKKIFSVILTLTAMLTLLVPAVFADSAPALVVDYADLLEQEEEAALQELLSEISEANQIEIAVVTTNSTNGKNIMDYADDFYDDYGYGYGENHDGVMLVLDMGNREYWITASGVASDYLDDDVIYEIEQAFIDDLSNGYYYDAFAAFARECDGRFGGIGILSTLVISLIVGFIITLIVVSTMKGKMTSVRAAKNATNYVVAGSLNLTSQNDRYLYSNTVRTPRNTDNNSSGSSGSSVHRSSSGRTHSGHGGKF